MYDMEKVEVIGKDLIKIELILHKSVNKLNSVISSNSIISLYK